MRSKVDDSVAVISAKQKMVGNRLLSDIRKLRAATIPEGVSEIGEQWFRGSAVESVAVPASVTEIKKEAFINCSSLRHVTFGAGCKLRTIGEQSFSGSGLIGLAIPSSVTTICKDAFRGCDSLERVTF